jgi:DNA-binding SARP family transcriptional activator
VRFLKHEFKSLNLPIVLPAYTCMSSPSYRLKVFGSPELLDQAEAPIVLSPRALAYLVYLRLGPEAKRRSHDLSVLLWGSKDRKRAAASLSQVRKEVMDAAPGLLKKYDRGHSLEGHLDCDTNDLLGVSLDERIAALDLLACGFMYNFEIPAGADVFGRWVESQRIGFRKEFLQRWSEFASSSLEPALLTAVGHIGLKHDPAWHEAAAWVVRGLVQQNRLTDAEAFARQHVTAEPGARASLVTELAATPSSETDIESEFREPGPGARGVAPGGVAHESHDGSEKAPFSHAETLPGADDHLESGIPDVVQSSVSLPTLDTDRHTIPLIRMKSSRGVVVLLLVLAATVVAVAAVVIPRHTCNPEESSATVLSEDYQPGSDVPPGQAFTKGWRLRNTGHCAWKPSFYLHFENARKDGVPWNGSLSRSKADIRFGHEVSHAEDLPVRVPMVAPMEPGSYEEFWSVRDDRGHVLKVDDSIALVASISVSRVQAAFCTQGQAADTFIAANASPRRTFRPLELIEFAATFRNTSSCTWPPGSRLNLTLPSGFNVAIPASAPSSEAIRPKQRVTYQQTVRLPARAGTYVIRADLIGTEGEPIGSHPIRVRVGRHDQYGGYPLCGPGEAGPRFVAETVADNTILQAGTEFQKVWTLTNASPTLCAWAPGAILRRSGGDSLSLAREIRIERTVLPGEIVTVQVPMRAPRRSGVHREDWQFMDWTGRALDISQTPTIWVLIIVPPTLE